MGIMDRVFGRDLTPRGAAFGPAATRATVTVLNADGSRPAGALFTGFTGTSGEMGALRPQPANAAKHSAHASRAIGMIVQMCAARPLAIHTATGEPFTHELTTLFNEHPNRSQAALTFRTSYLNRLMVHGQAFIVLDRGPSMIGKAVEANVFFGDVKVVLDPVIRKAAPHGDILRYELKLGSADTYTPFAPSEILWLRFPDPENVWGARAPLTAALDGLGLGREAREWQAGQLRNSGNPAGIVYVGNPSSQEDYNFAQRTVTDALTGPSNSGRIAVVGGEVEPKFIRTSGTAVEVGYLETIKLAQDDVITALGVPLELITGGATYANQQTALAQLWTGTNVPMLDMVASEINRQLLFGQAGQAVFDVSDVQALQEGRDAVSARTNTATVNDLITLDEGRAALGFDPLPGGAGAVTLTQYRAPHQPAAPAAGPAARAINAAALAAAMTVDAPLTAPPATLEYQVRGVSAERAGKDLDRLETAATRAIGRLADAQLKEAQKRLARNSQRADTVPAAASQVFNLDGWIERAQDYLLPILFPAFEGGAAATAAGLGLAGDITVDAFINDAAVARAAVLAEFVNGTTFQIIEDKLAAAAIADRIGVKDFAAILADAFTDLSGARAATIARTEMVAGFNAGSRAAALESGVVTGRQWLAAGGPRTRPWHAEMDGERTVGLDDPYSNGLLFPGDPSGRAADTINCRCTEQYVTSYTA